MHKDAYRYVVLCLAFREVNFFCVFSFTTLKAEKLLESKAL